MTSDNTGTLMIIGGHERGGYSDSITSEVAKRTIERNGRLILIFDDETQHDEEADSFITLFYQMNVPTVDIVNLYSSVDANDEKVVGLVELADTVFFVGNDRSELISRVTGTALHRGFQSCLDRGGLLVATAAAAVALTDRVINDDGHNRSPTLDEVKLQTGLELFNDVIIDTHFSQYGRLGRVLGALSQSPQYLGIGIDADTAIIVNDGIFYVVGSQAVYVVDASTMLYTNAHSAHRDEILTMSKVRLHMLGTGSYFDLRQRRLVLSGKRETGVFSEVDRGRGEG